MKTFLKRFLLIFFVPVTLIFIAVVIYISLLNMVGEGLSAIAFGLFAWLILSALIAWAWGD
jgi:hypothetical protein